MAENEKTFLDAQKTMAELTQLYQNDPRQDTFNLMILGEMGTGKSFMMRTCRKPALYHSFDPGGTKGLKKWIDKGEIIVDSRYEGDDPMNPNRYDLWVKEMDRLERMNIFKHFGTFILDSATSWGTAVMNSILKKAGIPGQQPRWSHDYGPQKNKMTNFLSRCLNLPCDFILIGHLEPYKDETTGKLELRFATVGKNTLIIPTMFDEVWVMDPKDGSTGVTYRVLTQSTGKQLARSRLCQDGLLDKYEKPDIKAILKKTGMNYEDKPLLTGGKNG